MLFDLGRIATTFAVAECIERPVIFTLLERYRNGDWGEMAECDKTSNDFSVQCGGRIFASYTLNSGDKLWFITEADRSYTTIMFPYEY